MPVSSKKPEKAERLREPEVTEAPTNRTVVCEGRIGGPVCAADDNHVAVDSTDDARIVNNVVRHEYRVLTEREKQQMQSIKDIGREMIEYLDHVGGTSHHSRELSLAKTKVEEAVMWAVKHVTA